MSLKIPPRGASSTVIAAIVAGLLGACLDSRIPTGTTPDQRRTSEAPAGGFTSQFEIPATWRHPRRSAVTLE